MKPSLVIKILIMCCTLWWLPGLVWAQEAAQSSSAKISSGATWVVALDGTGQFMSIQEAIDQSHSGDTIIIKPGKYAEDVTVHSKERLKVIGAGIKKGPLALSNAYKDIGKEKLQKTCLRFQWHQLYKNPIPLNIFNNTIYLCIKPISSQLL